MKIFPRSFVTTFRGPPLGSLDAGAVRAPPGLGLGRERVQRGAKLRSNLGPDEVLPGSVGHQRCRSVLDRRSGRAEKEAAG